MKKLKAETVFLLLFLILVFATADKLSCRIGHYQIINIDRTTK